jgi:glycosyltransferase involved in cell wall biosynthesis
VENEITRQKWSGGKPYYIYVGGINPRKNINNLLLAFDKFKTDSQSDIKLLLVGKKGFGFEETEKALNHLKSKYDIKFLGRIEDSYEVNKLISASIAMTYVSVFEGFGIPCLEAMRCGTAVITSNTSSMPEVCGDAALYVDPLSIESISGALKTLSANAELRQSLVEKGAVQSQKFSWQKTTDLLWEMIEECINE